jgi:hypothetical protein
MRFFRAFIIAGIAQIGDQKNHNGTVNLDSYHICSYAATDFLSITCEKPPKKKSERRTIRSAEFCSLQFK